MAATETADEGGEGYFASVSDLMVGILFVFLLMLTVFALNFRDEEDEQKVARVKLIQLQAELEQERRNAQEERLRAIAAQTAAIAAQREAQQAKEAAEEQRVRNEEFRRLLQWALTRLEEEAKGRQAARSRLLANLEKRLRENGISVIIDPESGVLRLPEQLLFDKGQPELGVVNGRGFVPAKLAEAQGNLAKLAVALGDVLPCFGHDAPAEGCGEQDRSSLEGVLIEGHSDKQGYREKGRQLSAEESRERNDRLSVERALNVFKELRQRNGLDDLRNGNGFPMLAVSAYGERRPIADSETEEGFRQNRRIDLRFLLSSRPSNDLEKVIDQIRSALGHGS